MKNYQDVIDQDPAIDQSFWTHDYELYKLNIMAAYVMGRVDKGDEIDEMMGPLRAKFVMLEAMLAKAKGEL